MRFALLLTALALAACNAAPREPASNNPVKWAISPAATQLTVGTATPVRLSATIAEGWYIYSITQEAGGPTPMSVTVAPSPPFSISGKVEGPAPTIVFDKEFNINTERYEGAPSFSVPVATAVADGKQPEALDIKVRFQACNATLCLPARTETLTSRVQVAAR